MHFFCVLQIVSTVEIEVGPSLPDSFDQNELSVEIPSQEGHVITIYYITISYENI